MHIAYFDTFAGISGDMTLGAFLSAGLSLEDLNAELAQLSLRGFRLECRTIQRNAISAVRIDVVAENEIRGEDEHHQRSLADIFWIIDESGLSSIVKQRAKRIFQTLGIAEAKVHNTTVEDVHFHEVGAVDSIIDIVGTAICLEKFGIEKIYSSPVPMGYGGFVDTQHGTMPLPAPATVEILKDYPTVIRDDPFELTTPTGAAIIAALSEGVLSNSEIRIKHVGYGAGSRKSQGIPNLLRVIIGEYEPNIEKEEIVIVEANIDDMNPEVYPFVIEKLIETGAHDAYLVPIIMKKGRPGILLSVMVEASRLDNIVRVIYSETSTIGLRMQRVERRKLPREQKEIDTPLGRLKVKAVVFDGVERMIPEFEECKRVAVELNLPLVEVYRILEAHLSSGK
jgi:uncharacterized protein (TIGR00299 family) protein